MHNVRLYLTFPTGRPIHFIQYSSLGLRIDSHVSEGKLHGCARRSLFNDQRQRIYRKQVSTDMPSPYVAATAEWKCSIDAVIDWT